MLVVGAGPAGCATALLLARAGTRVVLAWDPVSARARPTLGEVLPPPARPAFERLGLSELLDDPAHAMVPGTVAAWGPGDAEATDHVRSPFGEAVQLDRPALERGLRAAATEAGVSLVVSSRELLAASGVPVPGPVRDARAASATCGAWPRRRVPGPRVVVDATGRAASVARAAGANVERADRLVAVVGVLGPATDTEAQDRRVLVAATREGWWSTMVLTDGRRIAALHTDRDLLHARLRTDAAAWFEALGAVPWPGSAGTAPGTPPTEVRVVAAGSCRTTPGALSAPGGPAVVAVGDAEMAFDPLSSLGIMAALLSAEEAAGLIGARLASDRGRPRAALAADALAADDARERAREARWTRYRERLQLAYAAESRWPDAPFWSRRQATPHHAIERRV